MGESEIATKLAAARTYLRSNREDARYRDSPATATVEGGLRVRTTDPAGAEIVSDMTEGVGGGGTAPSPGWLLRAANASCIATLIAMRAAEEAVELKGLQVTVDSESDDYGILGLDEAVPSGPLSMRVVVRVGSASASEDRVRAIVAWGVAHCPVCDAVKRAVPVDVVVEVG
jgi:uncharacterized OsmC-like protein